MSVSASLVLLAVVWFMVLFVVLPLRLKTQGDEGARVMGTHASAPVDPQLKKRALIVTAITIPIWGILVWIISTGALPLDMLDFYSGIE